LRHLEKKSKEEEVKIETVKADMIDFRLKEKVDFAFIMMDSLTVKSNDMFLNHLDSVAASLNKGGLYSESTLGLDKSQKTKVDNGKKWHNS